MIDLHSHIIPGIDDGAKSAQISIEMLEKSFDDGVTDVVATSHCYPKNEKSIEHFLQRRKMGFSVLSEALKKETNPLPKIHLGCEVNLFTDIAELKNISDVCIDGTNYILVEMPNEPWKEWMIDSVYKLTVKNLRPIIAHIDRYMWQSDFILNSLLELDVVYQLNAEAFINKHLRKMTDKLISSGCAHVLGTDMHNMSNRAPDMGEAKEKIIKRYGSECMNYFTENAERLLENKPLKTEAFGVKSDKPFFSYFIKK